MPDVLMLSIEKYSGELKQLVGAPPCCEKGRGVR